MNMITFISNFSKILTPVNVFVFWGQSNMNGQGDKDELTGDNAKYAGAHTNIKIYGALTSGAFQNAEAGVNLRTTYDADLDFGPELSFLYDVAQELGETVYGIKYSPGGVALKQNAGDDWNIASHELYDILIYDNATNLSYCELAKKELSKIGLRPNYKAIIGAHGEQDANLASTSYEADFTAFINAVRSDLQNDSILNIFLKLRNITTYPADQVSVIRAAQESASTSINNSIMINHDDLGTSLHLNTAKTITAGQRLAAAYINTL